MGGGGGKAPKAPDLVGQAKVQGEENIKAARTETRLNRVNQSGPTGTVTFTQDPNNPDIYTQETKLSPGQQLLYNQTQLGQVGRTNLANERLFSEDGKSIGAGIDTSRLPEQSYRLPGADDFGAERMRVEDAMYNRGARRLDDQFSRREEDMRAQLLNRGLREGTEAYANNMRDFNESQTDAYGDLRDRAIMAGSSEQSRLFAQALQQANLQNEARATGIGEQQINQNQVLQGLDWLYGNGYQSPGMGGGGAGGANVQAGNFQDAAQAQYETDIGRYNADQANRTNTRNTYIGAAATIAAAF